MKINPKYIGCLGMLLSAALTIVPLSLHEIHHTGFFVGLWHGFAFLPRLAAACFVPIRIVAADNFPYFFGLFMGLSVTAFLVIKQFKTND
jgi:hypothetical protein